MPRDTINYERRSRSRSSRSSPEIDVLVVALTAQVILCVVVLVIALIAQQANKDEYTSTKDEYRDMMGSEAYEIDFREIFNGEAGGIAGLFASIENAIQSLLAQFQDGALQLPEHPSQSSQDSQDDEVDENPVFNFGYLDTQDIEYDGPLGQGGAFPVSIDLEAKTVLQAPEGCTFAPVVLGGYLKPPVTGLITSEFEYREHPVTGKADFHNGLDIAAKEGRPILATLPGKVLETGWSDIYGNYIKLEHSENLITFYAHCSELIAQEGSVVRQGERIALVGSTGMSTGPHLHFSVIVDGQYTNPYWVLKDNIILAE